jgi:hypothetical protein
MRGKIVWGAKGKEYFVEGKRVTKAEFDRTFPSKPIQGGMTVFGEADWSRPIDSYALAVHPTQVQEAMQDAAKKGVHTEFLPDGRPRFKSRNHRKQYMRAYGFFDRDAGYGDAGRHSYNGTQEPGSARGSLESQY